MHPTPTPPPPYNPTHTQQNINSIDLVTNELGSVNLTSGWYFIMISFRFWTSETLVCHKSGKKTKKKGEWKIKTVVCHKKGTRSDFHHCVSVTVNTETLLMWQPTSATATHLSTVVPSPMLLPFTLHSSTGVPKSNFHYSDWIPCRPDTKHLDLDTDGS